MEDGMDEAVYFVWLSRRSKSVNFSGYLQGKPARSSMTRRTDSAFSGMQENDQPRMETGRLK
jgi:hypothetical protein